ncbi:MAG: 2-phospho-L-lactate guanylyltransferase [Nocardioidaceae bacterium]
MTHHSEPTWVVVVPVKRAEIAKSRLTGVSAQQRAELARAFPADCAESALAAPYVHGVVVVTDDDIARRQFEALGADVIADTPDAGLNPALQHAGAYARRQYADCPVAALSGDLPALRPLELATALLAATDHPRAFLADHSGDGTTLLTALPDIDLDPHFGRGSCARHLDSGAVELDPHGLTSLRRDVDTRADLRDALEIGVGRHTREVLERLPLRVD